MIPIEPMQHITHFMQAQLVAWQAPLGQALLAVATSLLHALFVLCF